MSWAERVKIVVQVVPGTIVAFLKSGDQNAAVDDMGTLLIEGDVIAGCRLLVYKSIQYEIYRDITKCRLHYFP